MKEPEGGKNNKFYFNQSKFTGKLEPAKIPVAIVLGWVCFYSNQKFILPLLLP